MKLRNYVNDWIRAGDKRTRRLIVAGACVMGAILCLLIPNAWVRLGLMGLMLGIAAVKAKNALTDET